MDSREGEDPPQGARGEGAVRVRGRVVPVCPVPGLEMPRKAASRILRRRPGRLRKRLKRHGEGGLAGLPDLRRPGRPPSVPRAMPLKTVGKASLSPVMPETVRLMIADASGAVPHVASVRRPVRDAVLSKGGAPRPREQGLPPRGRRVAEEAGEGARGPAPPRPRRSGAGRGHPCARRRGGRQVLVARGRAGRRHARGQPRQGRRVRRASRGREATLPHARQVQRGRVRAVPAEAAPQVRQGGRHRGQGAAERRQVCQEVPAVLPRGGHADQAPGGVPAPECRGGVGGQSGRS